MPALSIKQRRVMAIAEHEPSKVFARNRGLTKMSKSQLHDFASTSERDLPMRKGFQRALRKQRRGK